MKVVSTFSGGGGSSTGYKLAGSEVLAMVEFDPVACRTYEANHPDTHIFNADIRHLTAADIMAKTGLAVGELDLLGGSPPCQGFSTAGVRRFDDAKNTLFSHQLRLIRDLQPKTIIIENVAGMVRGKMKAYARAVISELRSMDYQVICGVVPATAFGVPQLRPRTFYIGSRLFCPVFPNPTCQRAVTAHQALKGIGPEKPEYPKSPMMGHFARKARPGEKGSGFLARQKKVGHPLWRDKKDGSWFTKQKMDPNKPSPTITKTKDDLIHWTGRYLSIKEAAVLTGFPADYVFKGSFAQQWGRIGNAVAPPVSAAICKSLESQLGEVETNGPPN